MNNQRTYLVYRGGKAIIRTAVLHQAAGPIRDAYAPEPKGKPSPEILDYYFNGRRYDVKASEQRKQQLREWKVQQSQRTFNAALLGMVSGDLSRFQYTLR